MIACEDPIKIAIQSCLRYAAMRMHSRQEIVDYLSGKNTKAEIISQVITYLEKNNLIDDWEFAKQWAESRLKRGKGNLLIQAELNQKGIKREIIKETITAISPQAWIEAAAIAANKYGSKWQPLTGYEKKAALFRVLRMRGFSGRHIDGFVQSRVK